MRVFYTAIAFGHRPAEIARSLPVKKIKINFAGPLGLERDRGGYPYKSILESRYDVELSDRPDYVFVSQDPKSYRSAFSLR